MTGAAFFAGCVLGIGIGSLIQGCLWASNAKALQRKEWFGKLYKVEIDEDDGSEHA